MGAFIPQGFQRLADFVDEHGIAEARQKLFSGDCEAITFVDNVFPTSIPKVDWATSKAEYWLKTGVHSHHPEMNPSAPGLF